MDQNLFERIVEHGISAAIAPVARIYVKSWISMFVTALLSAAIINAFWRIPLYEVANVQLGLTLFWVMVLLGFFAILFVWVLWMRVFDVAAFLFVFASVYIFLPSASVLGYTAYGYLSGHEIDGTSTVFNWYMSHVSWLVTNVGDFIKYVSGHNLSQPALRYVPPMNEVPGWISAITSVISLALMFLGRRAPVAA